MCGILYCHVKDQEIQNVVDESFSEALNYLQYRGPDNYSQKKIGAHYFGHTRLSIIDLGESSNQPFEDEENLMIYNGEIYNYRELVPDSTSDTETLFNLLKRETNPFSKLRGMFAIGWFHKNAQQMTFYRDFYGEKPLYYFINKKIQIASSTLKSLKYLLKAVGEKVALNKAAIRADYLMFGYIREPETIWEKIYMLPPGHSMYFQNGKAVIKPLEFDLAPPETLNPDGSYLSNALSSKDVEGTLLLSGGVDSTFVLAKAVEKKISLRLGIYKADNSRIDESDEALEHINKIGAPKNLFPVSILKQSDSNSINVHKFIELLEQPTSDGLQLYQLLEHLRKQHSNLKLVYTGLGGDELFGGYPTYFNYRTINMLMHIPFIEWIVPAMKRFKGGRRILGAWDVRIYAFLYRFKYDVFKSLGLEDKRMIDAYNSYGKSIKNVPKEVGEKYINSAPFIIKRAETFDYARNQLLRDNDNISMYLGFESRSPLLNPDWYFQRPDRKNWLKKNMEKKFNLSFGLKKGFTLDEKELRAEFMNLYEKHKNHLQSIVEIPLPEGKKLDTPMLRQLLILVLWINKNG